MIPAVLEAAATATLAEPGARHDLVVNGMGPGEVVVGERAMVNLASNDYLGFARDPRVLDAARAAIDQWGLGSAAGRVLSGSTTLHRQLEDRLAAWVGCDEAVLHASCWSANEALFGTLALLAARASTSLAIFSDRLNHASIIDAIRHERQATSHLCLYGHDDLGELERQLIEVPADCLTVIVTDGVFSMEGDQAPLDVLCRLGEKHSALVVIDDSHGTGVVGASGRGTPEAQGMLGGVDVITGTLGKALGGAIGGFVAGPQDVMAALRATSRPYIFSNNPPFPVVAGALAALNILETDDAPLDTLRSRVDQLRSGISRLGLHSCAGDHPIVPVILGDEERARLIARRLGKLGVFVTAQTFPVVPQGEARLRLQTSAAHSEAAINQVLEALDQSRLGEPCGLAPHD